MLLLNDKISKYWISVFTQCQITSKLQFCKKLKCPVSWCKQGRLEGCLGLVVISNINILKQQLFITGNSFIYCRFHSQIYFSKGRFLFQCSQFTKYEYSVFQVAGGHLFIFGPSGVRALPLAAVINEGGHYWSDRRCADGV